MKDKRYSKGHFIGLGYAIGIPLGIPIGLALGNMALGPAIGVAIGAAIGPALEKKYNPNPIPLTEEEKKIRKKRLLIGVAFGLVALIAGIETYFLFR